MTLYEFPIRLTAVPVRVDGALQVASSVTVVEQTITAVSRARALAFLFESLSIKATDPLGRHGNFLVAIGPGRKVS